MGLDAIQNYIIGIILFVVVITGGMFVMGNFFSQDPSLDSAGEISQFNSSLNKAAEVTDSVQGIQDSIDAVSAEDSGILGWLNALVGSVYNGLKALGNSIGFMSTAATESSQMFGIPPVMVALILLVITVIIAFAIWSAIMRV